VEGGGWRVEGRRVEGGRGGWRVEGRRVEGEGGGWWKVEGGREGQGVSVTSSFRFKMVSSFSNCALSTPLAWPSTELCIWLARKYEKEGERRGDGRETERQEGRNKGQTK
jgi:hypothetical protein